MQFYAIAREETSALPWEVWIQESQRHGISSGLFAVIYHLIFLLWVFLVPGHLFANSVFKKSKTRPIYPYIVNILIGTAVSVFLCK